MKRDGMKTLVTVLLALIVFSPAVSAAEASYWHTSDHYTVELDGEGEAFVAAELNIKNIGSGSIDSLDLQMPYEGIEIYRAMQGRGHGSSDINYWTESFSSSNILHLNLDRPVMSGEETKIFLVYRTNQIARKSFSGWNFEFRTLKDNEAVTRDVGVNVEVPKDMSLKSGVNAEVDYQPSMMAEFSSMQSASRVSREIDSYSRSPDYSASNIDPGEAFRVSGKYGRHGLLLYLPETVAVIALILTGLFVQSRVDLFQALRERIHGIRGFNLFGSVATGFLTSFIFIISLAVVRLSLGLVESVPHEIQFLFLIAVLLADFTLVVTAFFGPPAYIGLRSDLRNSIISLLSAALVTLMLLFLAAAIWEPAVYAEPVRELTSLG